MSLNLDSKQEALAFRDELADSIDDIAETAADDLFDAMQGLRAAVVRDANDRIANLPAVLIYDAPETMPALVLAHRLHNDIRKEQDIIKRNAVKNPGFVTGQVEYLR